MARIALIFAAFLLATTAFAESREKLIDLRAPGAVEQLHRDNPDHFDKIERILAGLREEPKRVEGDWLKATFDARDIELSRQLIRTSNPPKQLLQFTLGDTRYILYVVRSDLGATIQPVEK